MHGRADLRHIGQGDADQFLEQAADIQIVAEADDGDMARLLIAQHKPDVAVLEPIPYRGNGLLLTMAFSGIVVIVHLYFTLPAFVSRQRNRWKGR